MIYYDVPITPDFPLQDEIIFSEQKYFQDEESLFIKSNNIKKKVTFTNYQYLKTDSKIEVFSFKKPLFLTKNITEDKFKGKSAVIGTS